MKTTHIALTAGCLLLAAYAAYGVSPNNVKLVKSGEYELICELKTGTKKIDPGMIEFEKDGYWSFKNGGASNCKMLKTLKTEKV